VRELKNIIERLVIMVPHNVITEKDIPPLIREYQSLDISDSIGDISDSFRMAKTDFEKQYIAKKLQQYDGNISKTAEAIGLERSNLHRKIKRYGLDDISR
jgi:two-component system nitrogen regulation response regulator NtrX